MICNVWLCELMFLFLNREKYKDIYFILRYTREILRYVFYDHINELMTKKWNLTKSLRNSSFTCLKLGLVYTGSHSTSSPLMCGHLLSIQQPLHYKLNVLQRQISNQSIRWQIQISRFNKKSDWLNLIWLSKGSSECLNTKISEKNKSVRLDFLSLGKIILMPLSKSEWTNWLNKGAPLNTTYQV